MAGHWRAGLCQVNILRSAVFSGMSGSALADAAGMGAVEIRAMVDAGYRPSDAAAMPAVSAMSATFGPVIPPSIAAVLYACRASRHTRCAGATLFGAGGLLARSV
jgi:TRAP-type C4-dicarboxylate transport system permease large subunit